LYCESTGGRRVQRLTAYAPHYRTGGDVDTVVIMNPGDWVKLLAYSALGVGAYRLANPKCPWCGAALDTISIAEAVACPQCSTAVTAAQAVLGRAIWRALFA